MKIENWPLEKIIPYEKNPRKNNQAVQVVANSLKQFGWRQPIAVDKDGVIIMGHTRLKAAQKLKLKEAPVHQALDLAPGQVKALRLMDNKSNEYADWDNELLIPELLDLKNEGIDLILTGFEKEEIDEILKDAKIVLRKIQTEEPIEKIWVLIGVPLSRYNEISKTIQDIASEEDFFVETTVE